MTQVKDQLGNTLTLSRPPQRIVSLVPSKTELLADLGLFYEVVGITRYCIYPLHWRKQKVVVGGTKDVDLEIIRQLKPDLILANKEENEQKCITELSRDFPVYISDIITIEDALEMIQSIGTLVQKDTIARQITKTIFDSFEQMEKCVNDQSVLYLIWRKPYMGVGSHTFINTLLEKIGFNNILSASRYPRLTESQMRALKPDYVLLSSEPFPFKEKHVEEIRQHIPTAKILLVDGEMFSWYGSRLTQSVNYFNTIAF